MEEWRAVLGYEGWYEASSLGRCRGIRRPRRGGPRNFNEPYPLILTPLVYRKGYLKVRLGECDGTRQARRLFLHRVVYEAFYGPIPAGVTVNHKNAVRNDNRPENLEFATYLEQAHHARRLGLVRYRRMSGWHTPSLTEDGVREIRRLYATGEWTQAALGLKFDTCKSNIRWILKRHHWRHV